MTSGLSDRRLQRAALTTAAAAGRRPGRPQFAGKQETSLRRDRIAAENAAWRRGADAAEGEAPAVRRGKLRPATTAILVPLRGPACCAIHRPRRREKVEQPVLHHAPGAAAAFLAGWKMKWTVPEKSRVAARWRAAPSSIVVWPSWPQHASFPLSWICKRAAIPASERIHVGAQADRARAVADLQRCPAPVLPRPRWTLRPALRGASLRGRSPLFSKPSSGKRAGRGERP